MNGVCPSSVPSRWNGTVMNDVILAVRISPGKDEQSVEGNLRVINRARFGGEGGGNNRPSLQSGWTRSGGCKVVPEEMSFMSDIFHLRACAWSWGWSLSVGGQPLCVKSPVLLPPPAYVPLSNWEGCRSCNSGQWVSASAV